MSNPTVAHPSSTETSPEPPRRHPALRVALFGAKLAASLCLVAMTLWACAALYFDFPAAGLRVPITVGYFAAVLALSIMVKRRWLASLLVLGAFGLVLAGWLSLKPSNDRIWQPDLATLAYAEMDGNRITLRNIRNCDYRTETDFDTRYYDKELDLGKLRTADLHMVYWGSPHMAHTMVSFGFEGGDYVCFSVETRKEKGESYSAIRGLFRQFELIYVVADERDVVRLRSNFRKGEDCYLYRLQVTPERARQLFLDYIARINQLRNQPEWYSALTQNCTTSIRTQRASSERAPWDWRMLVNGHGDTLLYEMGAIPTNAPFAELKQKCHINERAKAADQAQDFSRRIREGLPGM